MSQAARQVPDRLEPSRPHPAAQRPDEAVAPVMPSTRTADTPGALMGRGGPRMLLALQRAAGNRAVTRAMDRVTVQRHPEPTSDAEAESAAGAEGGVTEPAATTEGPAGGAGATTEGGAAGTAASVEEATAGGVTEGATTQAGATTQPGTGTTGPAGGGLTGAARRSAIEQILAASDTGRWAQAIITRWSIPVDYEYSGQGSFHQGGNIYINRSLGIGAAAMTVMHEAQHANTYKTGRGADRESLSREEYIRRSIADEAEAVVRQIEGLAVTAGLGVDMSGNPITDSLKQRYLRAFYAKRDQLRASNPGMSTAEINDRCRTATRDGEVTNWFYDGTFVTSTNNNSYAVFYGNQWDEVHRAPGRR